LPFGYYRAGWYCGSEMRVTRDDEQGRVAFAVQHPAYIQQEMPGAKPLD
jgi:hypothetical protein